MKAIDYEIRFDWQSAIGTHSKTDLKFQIGSPSRIPWSSDFDWQSVIATQSSFAFECSMLFQIEKATACWTRIEFGT